jgi:hypothetical protein
MFDHRSHDFGTVARGTKVEHKFPVQNIYKKEVHIDQLVAPGGYANPFMKRRRLKSWEKSEIVVRMNTRLFRYKTAEVRVFFDEPYRAEVSLTVRIFVRRDITVSEEAIRFDSVPAGDGAERAVTIRYAGRPDWKILKVEFRNPHLRPTITKVSAQKRGKATYQDYELRVKLDKEAPVGPIEERLMVVTNDPEDQGPRFPVIVEGNVVRSDESQEPSGSSD